MDQADTENHHASTTQERHGDVRVGSGLLMRGALIEPFDRGNGVSTRPFVGRWNCDTDRITTGTTSFAVGTGIPLHTHNVEESVLVLSGEAGAQVGEDIVDVDSGSAVWVPAGIAHRFFNRGNSEMVIYWVYGGRDVTRTIVATGETFEHLSDRDRGAVVE